MRSLFLGVAMLGLAVGGEVLAQSPDYMMEDCRNNSQIFFQDFDARSVPTYEGQRTDGTHAVNGTIYRRGGEMTYQCSYNAAGNKMVDFFTESLVTHSWPEEIQTPMCLWSQEQYRSGFVRAGFRDVQQHLFVDPDKKDRDPEDLGTLCTIGIR